MRFEMIRAIGAGAAADPSPRTAPQSVLDVMLLAVPATLKGTDDQPRRLLLTAEGTAANTISVRLWALDETAQPPGPGGTPIAAGDRKFYEFSTADIVVTVAQLREVLLHIPGPGLIYVQVVTAPAAAGWLKVACA